MTDRRDFLKASLVVAAGVAAGKVSPALAGTGSLPKGLIYTAEDQGQWAGKAGSHAPVVSIDGNKVTIETKHPMTEPHFIVRHTLVSDKGEVLGAKTFSAADAKAVSVFELEAGKSARYVTSFCNKHDFWVTEIGS
jgi:superoxide reductase